MHGSSPKNGFQISIEAPAGVTSLRKRSVLGVLDRHGGSPTGGAVVQGRAALTQVTVLYYVRPIFNNWGPSLHPSRPCSHRRCHHGVHRRKARTPPCIAV